MRFIKLFKKCRLTHLVWIVACLFALIIALKPDASLVELLPALIIALLILLGYKYQQTEDKEVEKQKQKDHLLTQLVEEMQAYQEIAPLSAVQHWLFDYISRIQENQELKHATAMRIANHLALGEHLLNRAYSAQLDNYPQAAYNAQIQALSHFRHALHEITN